MRRVENCAYHLRDRTHVCVFADVEVNAIDLIADIAVVVFKPQDCRVQRYVHNVVRVLRRNTSNFSLRTELWRNHPNHAEPCLIRLYVLSDWIGRAEQTRTRGCSQHANWGSP